MSGPEPLDVEGALGALNDALTLQMRSALSYTLAAGSLVGFQFAPLAAQFGDFATAELVDARHLVEKIAALEGQPTTELAPVRFTQDPRKTIQTLIEQETEAIDALKSVIQFTGQEGRSEALEHRLEHIIMRKQEQVDELLRAVREP